jgi:aspartokinase-like uncharacterized kinase
MDRIRQRLIEYDPEAFARAIASYDVKATVEAVVARDVKATAEAVAARDVKATAEVVAARDVKATAEAVAESGPELLIKYGLEALGFSSEEIDAVLAEARERKVERNAERATRKK